MTFAHDTESALQSAAALVNTAGEPDEMTTPEHLRDFIRSWQWTGIVTGSREELEEVLSLRETLRNLWTADEKTLVNGVNELLLSGPTLPQLESHDDWGWHLHATRSHQPLAERMAVEAAMGLVDVIRSDEVGRLQSCAAEDCDDVLIDLSRNRSRRFCSERCGNRMAAAAYRERRRSPA